MLEQTRAILLHTVKYSDNSTIAHLYTEKYGRTAVLVRHSKSKIKGTKKSILQPLFLLNVDLQYKQNREIQQCQEISNSSVFYDIPFNIIKSSIVLFLSEFLSKVLKEEEANSTLFNFLNNSIQLFEQANYGSSNFHLVFLYELSKFLGFYPDNNFSSKNKYFNIREGFYSEIKESNEISLNEELSAQINNISNTGIKKMHELKLSRMQRTIILEAIIKYYHYHLPGIGKIKSLEILNQVFGD